MPKKRSKRRLSIDRTLLISLCGITFSTSLLTIFIIVSVLFPKFGEICGITENLPDYVQVIIEAAALAGLVFAASEFSKSRLKPELSVWILPVHKDPQQFPTKETDKWYKREVNSPSVVYTFKFHLYLGNLGEAAAKYVKIIMSSGDKIGKHPTKAYFSKTDRAFEDNWDYPMGEHNVTNVFHGKDGFISYLPGEAIPDNLDQMDDLGEFKVIFPVELYDETENSQIIDFLLYAENMPRIHEEITLYLRETNSN